MIFGLAEMGAMYAHGVRAYVAQTGVPMLVVDYRVAPEHPDPIPVGDCYAALCWLADNAADSRHQPGPHHRDGGQRRWWGWRPA